VVIVWTNWPPDEQLMASTPPKADEVAAGNLAAPRVPELIFEAFVASVVALAARPEICPAE
jgi:hypothetical protein